MTHAPRSLLRPLYFVMVIVVTVLATQSVYMQKHHAFAHQKHADYSNK